MFIWEVLTFFIPRKTPNPGFSLTPLPGVSSMSTHTVTWWRKVWTSAPRSVCVCLHGIPRTVSELMILHLTFS